MYNNHEDLGILWTIDSNLESNYVLFLLIRSIQIYALLLGSFSIVEDDRVLETIFEMIEGVHLVRNEDWKLGNHIEVCNLTVVNEEKVVDFLWIVKVRFLVLLDSKKVDLKVNTIFEQDIVSIGLEIEKKTI